MGFSTKKYFSLFILAFLLGSFAQVKAQTNDAVNIRCVSVDSAGDVTLTWVPPSASSLTSDNAISYVVNMGTSPSGPWSVLPGIAVTAGNSTTIPVASLPATPNGEPIYFYITTNNNGTTDFNSTPTASTIYLQLYNTIGTAQLSWNAVSKPLPQQSSTWYQVYREYNYAWSLIGSTQNLSYTDTITYCDSTFLNYRVEIADSTGCISSSNIADGGAKFKCTIGPPIPIMDTVSVTAGNTVDIGWTKSTKKDVIGYVIFEVQNGINVPIDTVWGINNDSLINYTGGGNPGSSVLSFLIEAIDGCRIASALSPIQHTLLLNVVPDACAETNTLTWNRYTGIDGTNGGYGIKGYRIFYSINSGPYQLLGKTDPNTTTYIDSNLTMQETRCYYIQVYDSVHTASSNIVCEQIKTPPTPQPNYLQTASVILNTSSIYVLGYMDTLQGAAYYAFKRSTDSTGGFSTIYTMPAPTATGTVTISYTDNAVSPTKESYHYKIFTLNSCNKVMDSTNLGQTMLLTATGKPNSTNVLTWNDYRNWYAGPAKYQIYRSEDGINYTLLSPSVKYTNAGENEYIDNVSSITVGQGTFYYYIKALENDTVPTYPYPFRDSSYSNIAEAYQNPIVFIPDAFCPNGVNKVFMPVGVFIDAQGYDLTIINRWGDLVFESKDPAIGWDGTYKEHKVVPEGVYVYLLTYTSSKGEYFQRKGTVTLLK